MRSLVAPFALVAIGLCASAARADAPSQADQALAQTLFDRAVDLMDKKDYASACPMLAESQRLDPAGGTLLNLGLCREHEGKVASAWIAYNDALSQAIKDGRKDRESTARARLEAIGDKISRVTVEVSPAAQVPGLEVALDGTPLRQVAWGVAAPIDRGDHTLVARAPGKKPWEAHVAIESDGEAAKVTVPALVDEPVAATQEVARPAPLPAAPEPREHTRPMAGTLGLVSIAAGGVTLAAGAVLGGLAIARRSESNDECPADRCTQRGVDLNEQAKSLAWACDVALGVGVVLATVGVVLVLTAPKSASRTPPGLALVF